MCGIAGIMTANDALPQAQVLDGFARALAHRGPDGKGRYSGAGVGLVQTRLAIIDLKTGDQPLYSADRNLALVFNGEIYNAPELRRTLEAKGHRFVTDHSDTEVILRGYEEIGRAHV